MVVDHSKGVQLGAYSQPPTLRPAPFKGTTLCTQLHRLRAFALWNAVSEAA